MTVKSNAGSQRSNKRRIMRALKINEISGVDVPAQEGAIAVIMKRRHLDGPEDQKKKKKSGQPDNFQTDKTLAKGAALTTEEEGFTHLVILNGSPAGVELSSGETTWQDGHNHPWVRTPSGEIILGIAESSDGRSHTHTIAAMSKVKEDDNNQAAGETGKINKEINMADKTNKDGNEPTVEELQTQLARANSVASLNDAEKAHFEGLKGADADTFLSKSADERTTELKALAKAAAKNKADDDPVEYTTMDGIELHKSAGAAFIAMAKSNDVLRKRVDKSDAELDNAKLEKRAETELAHIPGDIKTRAVMLKAIDGIEDKDQREAAMNALRAQNTSMSKAFITAGHGGETVPGSPEDKLDTLAKTYHAKNPELTKEQAYSKVLETEEGTELYNKSVN